MRDIYKDYLFEKHILVSEETTEEKHMFEVLFAMAHFFGVRITKGKELVHCEMIRELSKRLGEKCSGTVLQRISGKCSKSFGG